MYFTTIFKKEKQGFKLDSYSSLRTHSTCHTYLIPGDLIKMVSSMCTLSTHVSRAKRRCRLWQPPLSESWCGRWGLYTCGDQEVPESHPAPQQRRTFSLQDKQNRMKMSNIRWGGNKQRQSLPVDGRQWCQRHKCHPSHSEEKEREQNALTF